MRPSTLTLTGNPVPRSFHLHFPHRMCRRACSVRGGDGRVNDTRVREVRPSLISPCILSDRVDVFVSTRFVFTSNYTIFDNSNLIEFHNIRRFIFSRIPQHSRIYPVVRVTDSGPTAPYGGQHKYNRKHWHYT